MNEYYLLLDERGSFNNDEKYIVIGGVLFNKKDYSYLEKIFMPFHNNLCEVLKSDELHSCKIRKLKDYVLPLIGSIEEIKPVVLVIDKQETFIFDKYDKISFKYNKAIEHLVNKLVENDIIEPDAKIMIKLDNINTSKIEQDNMKNYLKRNHKNVKSVEECDSKSLVCIQLADIIVNSFSTKQAISKNNIYIRLMKPSILYFLKNTEVNYIREEKNKQLDTTFQQI